jgi:hypothetical protein
MVTPLHIRAGFIQLDDKHIAPRLAEICAGRTHEPRRLAKLSQFTVGHFP